MGLWRQPAAGHLAGPLGAAAPPWPSPVLGSLSSLVLPGWVPLGAVSLDLRLPLCVFPYSFLSLVLAV